MGVQAHEVFLAADYIERELPKDVVASIIEKTAEMRRDLAGMTPGKRNGYHKACPLLRDGSCGIYPARPEVCRAHHGHSASLCAQVASDTERGSEAFILPLRLRMFSVMLAIDHSFVEAGYDGRAYDFHGALHAALTDGDFCRMRWAAKKHAFPDDCREPIYSEGGEHGEVRPVRSLAMLQGLGA